MSHESKRVRALAKKWSKRLGLWRWNIVIEMCPEECADAAQQNMMIFAECTPHWEYENATITFYVPHIKQLSDYELENVVIHEFMHCILDEAEIKYSKSEERVATALARAFQYCQN